MGSMAEVVAVRRSAVDRQVGGYSCRLAGGSMGWQVVVDMLMEHREEVFERHFADKANHC